MTRSLGGSSAFRGERPPGVGAGPARLARRGGRAPPRVETRASVATSRESTPRARASKAGATSATARRGGRRAADVRGAGAGWPRVSRGRRGESLASDEASSAGVRSLRPSRTLGVRVAPVLHGVPVLPAQVQLPTPKGRFETPPRVTVQLPVYNEMNVVERLIGAVARLDYRATSCRSRCSTTRPTRRPTSPAAAWSTGAPRGSTSPTSTGRTARVQGGGAGERPADGERRVRGRVRRPTSSFPGLPAPHRGLLTDPDIGMVQVRWEHLNRQSSALTQVAEHPPRRPLRDRAHRPQTRSGRFFNFNGTAGIWRRETSPTPARGSTTRSRGPGPVLPGPAGGLEFVFLPEVTAPAEIPAEMKRLKAQQHAGPKGSIQTAMKLLPRIFRADLPRDVKKRPSSTSPRTSATC